MKIYNEGLKRRGRSLSCVSRGLTSEQVFLSSCLNQVKSRSILGPSNGMTRACCLRAAEAATRAPFCKRLFHNTSHSLSVARVSSRTARNNATALGYFHGPPNFLSLNIVVYCWLLCLQFDFVILDTSTVRCLHGRDLFILQRNLKENVD